MKPVKLKLDYIPVLNVHLVTDSLGSQVLYWKNN